MITESIDRSIVQPFNQLLSNLPISVSIHAKLNSQSMLSFCICHVTSLGLEYEK